MDDQENAQGKQVYLGFAFTFSNEQLDINWFGSPAEIMAHAQASAMVLREVAHHLQTKIEAQQVFKHTGHLKFESGAHALALMQLMDAIAQRDYPKVTSILDEHPEVLTGEHDAAVAPFAAALAAEDLEAVMLLLERGGQVDRCDHFGMTALHWAAATGQSVAASALVAADSNKSRRSSFLWTPAHLAHANGHAQLASLLMKNVITGSWLEEPMQVLKEMGC